MNGWFVGMLMVVVAFAAGWIVRQIYGSGIIAKLEGEKLALEAEARELRNQTAAWVGGKAKATRL